jgi:hypothetical protein
MAQEQVGAEVVAELGDHDRVLVRISRPVRAAAQRMFSAKTWAA